MNWWLRLFIVLAAMLPASAEAAWLRASSDHFVVYANDSESKVRTLSSQLERYHAAMVFITGRNVAPPSPSNRVTVFAVSGESEVKRLYGENSRYVGGFYIPRAGSSVAIVPRVSTRGSTRGDLDVSMVTLLHEYAHHFIVSTSSFPMPRWLSEGAAEFFASASFATDGGVGIGRPAQHRAGELFYARDVTAANLIDPEAYEKRNHGRTFDAFYGKSWLLYHYLIFDKDRSGQLTTYSDALVAGKSSREAGLLAFGDMAKLERDLDRYLARSKVLSYQLTPDLLRIGRIDVAPVSRGEAEIMSVRIRSRRGVDDKQAAALLPEARAVAARFPGDPAVLASLAEAEFDAGNDSECIAAADKAIALDRTQTNAYVQKGFALFRQAKQSQGTFADYKKARAPFVALNRVENDHPLPLIYFYLSYAQSGEKPTDLAIKGLERAVQLAPFDLGLRMTLATQHLRDGRADQARKNLVPIAYNPHGGGLAEAAQKAMAQIDADPSWRGEALPVGLLEEE